jgi:hypothetical protein
MAEHGTGDALFPLHNARLLPVDVNQLMLSGGWLLGTAADPSKDYRVEMPRDFDICAEPSEAPVIRTILASWLPVRHTRFGGTTYRSQIGPHSIDVWFSSLGETFRWMRPDVVPRYAYNMAFNVGIVFHRV